MCPKNLVDTVRQFVTRCKKNEQTFPLLLSPRLCMEIPVTKVGALCEKKKLETTQASRHRASGGSPSGRPTGVL